MKNNKLIVGTNCFPSLSSAIAYYRAYGMDESDIKEKIQKKEIVIGSPFLRPGEAVRIIDGRYHIIEK